MNNYISINTIYYAEARNSTTACLSTTRTPVTAILNPLPTAPIGTNGERCSTGTVDILATPGAGETIDWYSASTGGSVLASGTGVTSFTTPSILSTTIYFAETRISLTGCLSASRTAVTATVNSSAPIGNDGSRCSTGAVIISATPGTGETIDWYAASTGGSVLASGVISFTTPIISSTTIYYAESRNSITGCLSATRTAVTATVVSLPVSVIISSSASANTICPGTSVTFTAIPTSGGASPTYQWKKNGTDVGTNSSTYTTTGLTNNDAITVVLTSSESCVSGSPATSNSISTIVNPITVITAQPTAQTVCRYSPATLSVTVTGAGTLSYQWYSASAPTGNVGSSASTYNTATTGLYGNPGLHNYYCTVAGTCGTVVTNTVAVTVSAIPSGTVSSVGNENICAGAGNTAFVSISANPDNYLYRGVITVTNLSTSEAQNLSFVTDGAYLNYGVALPSSLFPNTGSTNIVYSVKLTVLLDSTTFCAANTAPGVALNVTVQPTPVITAAPVTICSGDAPTLTVNFSGAGSYDRSIVYGSGITAASGGIGSAVAVSSSTFSDNALTNSSTSANGTATYTLTPRGSGSLACVGSPISTIVTINASLHLNWTKK